MIVEGANVNETTLGGYTVLHFAVVNNDIEIVNVLLAAGAGVNQTDNNGWTSLHFAVVHDDVEVVNILLAAGADVNQRDNGGNTPLHDASTLHLVGLSLSSTSTPVNNIACVINVAP